LLSLGAVCCALPLYLLVNNSFLLAILSSFLYFWIGPAGVFLLSAVVLISSGQKRERNVILFTVALSASLILSPILQAGILKASENDLAISMAVFSPLIGVPLIFFARLRQDADLSMKSNFDLSFLRNRSYALGVLSNEIFSIPFTLLLTFGGIFSKNELGVSYSIIESMFTLFFSISLMSRLFLTRIKIPKHYLIFSVTVATGIGLFSVYRSSSLLELAFSFILLGYSHGVYYPTASNYIADATLRQKFAGANSLSTIIDQVVTSASLPIMGAISGFFGLRLVFLVFEIPVLTLSGIFFQVGLRHNPTRPSYSEGA
jgi:DHA1 family multidrug resistance protein-like MFS transporter